MPKITVTNSQGLVQEAGVGGLKVAHSSVSGSAGVEGVRVAGGGASGFMHVVQGSTVMSSSATVHHITSLVPQGSRVLCGEVQVTTPGYHPFNITSVGSNETRTGFAGAIALSSSLGSQVISPISLITSSTGSFDVLVTTGDTGTSWPGGGSDAGVTVQEGVVRVSLFCVTAATTEG